MATDKNIKECLDVLQESDDILSGIGFEVIRSEVEKNILKNKNEISKIISEDSRRLSR